MKKTVIIIAIIGVLIALIVYATQSTKGKKLINSLGDVGTIASNFIATDGRG